MITIRKRSSLNILNNIFKPVQIPSSIEIIFNEHTRIEYTVILEKQTFNLSLF